MLAIRKLIIKLSPDEVEMYGFSHDRNYFFFEIEHSYSVIQERSNREGINYRPISFECLIDGYKVLSFYLHFDNGLYVEDQILQKMNGDLMKDFQFYVQQEKKVFANKEFFSFAVRFDQVLGGKSFEPVPFLLGINKLESLFSEIQAQISSGFYSVLENIISSIADSYKVTVENIQEELLLASRKDEGNEDAVEISELDSKKLLQLRVNSWIGIESNFEKFKKHVVSNYVSVGKVRITSLQSRFSPYQSFQEKLFTKYVDVLGFIRCWEINECLELAFIKKFNELLFEGVVISSDEMVQTNVLYPVIQEMDDDVLKEYIKVQKIYQEDKEKKEKMELLQKEQEMIDSRNELDLPMGESDIQLNGGKKEDENLNEEGEKVIVDEETGEIISI